VLSMLMVLVGLALIVQSISGSDGAISGRMLLGVLFTAAGVARTYLELRRKREA